MEFSEHIESSSDASQLIDDCLAWSQSINDQPVLLALPFSMPEPFLRSLLDNPMIIGVMSRDSIDSDLTLFEPNEQWVMPRQQATTILCIGPRALLKFDMVRQAKRHHAQWLVYRTRSGYRRERVMSFLTVRLFEKFGYITAQQLDRHLIAPLLRACAKQFDRAKRTTIGRPLVSVWNRTASQLRQWQTYYQFHKMVTAADLPLLNRADFIDGRVIVINTSLYHGGAERQLVNSLLELKKRGFSDLTFLCDSLDPEQQRDFYLWHLQQASIEAAEIAKVLDDEAREQLGMTMIKRIETLLEPFPLELAEPIAGYLCQFLLRRPQVVYLWQDYTSIIAGTAALLAGVPRIVLNSRNIAPDCGHLYFLDYFQPGYKVLLKQPNVTLINNSRAGADDYARWLKLPKDRIVILHNGFEPESITPTTEAESAAYRTTLNIPADASVVGSIFRLVPQKDPLLWVDTAALVAKARPDIHFLLIGGGYMLEPIRQLAEKAGIAERLHTPGTTTNPALPLSLFDLFLLTSRLEGIPNVLLEAQWLGIPAVSTDAGGARDALIDGKTGWIVDSRDPGEIARQVLFAMNNDEWYQAAKAAAPRHIAQHFGMERMVDETIGHLGLGGCPRID